MQKAVRGVFAGPKPHWVGDGFPVRNLLNYDALGEEVSPFLLLDYLPLHEFAAAARPRGVGEHPHRGFETVTLVYSGEVAHRDSTGGGGVIGPGDVQWMTAGSGILHEEFHSPEFTRRGGSLELVQLWINLPGKHKMTAPRYQNLASAAIPRVALPDEAGRLRVIAGEYAAHRGPAATFTALNLWDLRLDAGKSVSLRISEGHCAAIAVLTGRVNINGSAAESASLVALERAGEEVRIDCDRVERDAPCGGASLLVMSGQPLAEPIVGYGPFVMNSPQEIATAMQDFRSGRFGKMPPTVLAHRVALEA